MGVTGLRHWSCNQLVPGSSPPLCYSLSLFLVALSQIVGYASYFGQMVCLWPVKIFKVYIYIYISNLFPLALKSPNRGKVNLVIISLYLFTMFISNLFPLALKTPNRGKVNLCYYWHKLYTGSNPVIFPDKV